MHLVALQRGRAPAVGRRKFNEAGRLRTQLQRRLQHRRGGADPSYLRSGTRGEVGEGGGMVGRGYGADQRRLLIACRQGVGRT